MTLVPYGGVLRLLVASNPQHQMVGCHLPVRRVASKSPGQGGMEMQMNFRSESDTFRY